MRRKGRVCYIEILIILCVLGMVGKTVAPKLAGAGVESRVSSLIDGLEAMRAHLDLYRGCHGGVLPPMDSFSSFAAAMTTRTQRYSPRIRIIPTNPFNDLNTVRFDGASDGAGRAGWRLDTKSGLFQADDSVAHAAL